ncbi:hypothetical protein E0387_23535 [Escherichia coli]|nr:hypothetical protein [Escherichia coli]
MKYKKTLNALLAIIAVALSSAVCAATKTEIPSGPTTVLSHSTTTVSGQDNMRYEKYYSISSSSLISTCIFIPKRRILWNGIIRLPQPIIVESTYHTPTCSSPGVNVTYTAPAGSIPILSDIIVNNVRMYSMNASRWISYSNAGSYDANFDFFYFDNSAIGATSGALNIEINAHFPAGSIDGAYPKGIRTVDVLSSTGPSAVIDIQSGLGTVAVASEKLELRSHSWNINCSVNENCGSAFIFNIQNQSQRGVNIRPDITYTKVTAGSTCPTSVSGNILMQGPGLNESVSIQPGSVYTKTIQPNYHVGFYYEIPVSSTACQLSEHITLNVTLP